LPKFLVTLLSALLLFSPVSFAQETHVDKRLLRVVVFDVANDPVPGMPVEIVDISGMNTHIFRAKRETDADGKAEFQRDDFQKFKLLDGKHKVEIRVGESNQIKEEREMTLDPDWPVTIEMRMPSEGERPRGVAAFDKFYKRDRHRDKVGY